MKVFWLAYLVQTAVSRSCKCIYGQPCWPSDAEFASLEANLSQPLLYPRPPESACYPAENPSGNCTAVVLGDRDGRWRSDQPGSMQSPNFETFIFPNGTISACYLNVSLGFPCEQGSVSPVAVDARSVQDVQLAVNFAVKHNLKFVIKNTGHDYLGRSAAKGSFLLWTHHLKNITYNDSFVPQGAPSSETYQAITLGAGVQWHEAYDAIQAQGRFLVGGLSAGASVGAAGGWISGGGHSAFSAKYGLGVDNVIQFSIVTSSGSYLTVNAHQHPDLFWALRGGGGSTYGVLTAVTYRTWPSTPLTGAFLLANFSSPDIGKDVITEFIRTSAMLADVGWGGYAFFDSTTLQMFFVAPNVSYADATAAITPFFSFASNKTTEVQALTVPFDSFYTWYTTLFLGGEQVGANIELISRLMPRSLLEQEPQKVAETLLGLNTSIIWNHVAGGAVSQVDPDSVGLNPAWRQASSLVEAAGVWPEGASSADIRQVRNGLKAKLDVLRSLADGTYFNEASLYEPNPQKTFFGSHYNKLEKIKSLYDPHHLFVVAEGVGSEKWDDNLLCFH